MQEKNTNKFGSLKYLTYLCALKPKVMNYTPYELYVAYRYGNGIDICYTTMEECVKEVDLRNDSFETYCNVHEPTKFNKRPYRAISLDDAMHEEKDYAKEL